MPNADHPAEDGLSWVLPEGFETDDGIVRWARLGEGGNPVVLVHGTPYSSILWRDIAPALARSRTVYVLDHLGYGRSDKHEGQDLTLAAQARRFVALLEHWGLDEPSVVANDIGGAIVLRAHLIESARCRDLTIFDPVSGGRWERGLFGLMREHPGVFGALPGYAHEALVTAHLQNASHRGSATGGPRGLPRPMARRRGSGSVLPPIPPTLRSRYPALRGHARRHHDPGAAAVGAPRPDSAAGIRHLAARANPTLDAALDRRRRAPAARGRTRAADRPPDPRPHASSHRVIDQGAGPRGGWFSGHAALLVHRLAGRCASARVVGLYGTRTIFPTC